MPTLAATVDATLQDKGITKTEFCRSLGISRTTLARWETSFPSPDTLRSISTALDLPYTQLVTAALCSAGYFPTGDALPGLDVYLVVNTCEPDDDDSYNQVGLPGSGPVAAYTNLADAERYVASANRVAAFSPSFDTQILALDASAAPQIIDIFTTNWRTDGDIIHTSTSRSAHVPERFSRTRTTPVRARTNPDTGLVEGLEVASLDSDVGEHLLREYLEVLDEHGLKHPASAVSPTPERSPAPSSNMQIVPTTFGRSRHTEETPPTASSADDAEASFAWLRAKYHYGTMLSAHSPSELVEQVRASADATRPS